MTDRVIELVEVETALLGDHEELVRDRELEVAPGIRHELDELGLEGLQADDLRGDRGEDFVGRLESVLVEGGNDLGERLDLVQRLPFGHAFRAERDLQTGSFVFEPAVEVFGRPREERGAHDDQCVGRDVIGVGVEDAQHVRQLRLEMLVDRRAGDEHDDIGALELDPLGRSLQPALERELQLGFTTLFDEGKFASVDPVDRVLVDIDECDLGPGKSEFDPQREPDMPATADHGDARSQSGSVLRHVVLEVRGARNLEIAPRR